MLLDLGDDFCDGIIEWCGLKGRGLKDHLILNPWRGQGHFPLEKRQNGFRLENRKEEESYESKECEVKGFRGMVLEKEIERYIKEM